MAVIIKEEEEDFRNNNYKLEKKLIIKENSSTDDKFKTHNNIDINMNENSFSVFNRKWLKYSHFSFRYDTFSLLYTMVYRFYIDYFKIPNNNNISTFNDITNKILKMGKNELENGIWDLLIKYDNNLCNFKNNCFKEQSSITQLFHYFNNNEYFCITYTEISGCSYCSNYNQAMKYLPSIISFSLDELNTYDINTKINNLLLNELYICPICNYKDGIIIDANKKTLSKTILNWKLPKILIAGFETAIWEDIDDQNNIPDIIL